METEILRTLHDKITLFPHLGVTFNEVSSSRVVIHVDLQKNLNHKGTAFGGSLYTTAVVTAYALVLAGLRTHKISTENIVIAKGGIEYLRPVTTNFEIICEFPASRGEADFYAELSAKGRGRQSLGAHIMDSGGSLCAVFEGSFVVKL